MSDAYLFGYKENGKVRLYFLTDATGKRIESNGSKSIEAIVRFAAAHTLEVKQADDDLFAVIQRTYLHPNNIIRL